MRRRIASFGSGPLPRQVFADMVDPRGRRDRDSDGRVGEDEL
jgi:hypothetical protein